MIKIFTTTKEGKISLTKKELEDLLNEAYWEGYNSNRTTTITYPYNPLNPYYTLSSNGTLTVNATDYTTTTDATTATINCDSSNLTSNSVTFSNAYVSDH